MSLRDGMKEKYTSLLHTSIQIILIDMQGMRGTQRRSEELLHGNFSFFLERGYGGGKKHLVTEELERNYTDASIQKKLSLNNLYLIYE